MFNRNKVAFIVIMALIVLAASAAAQQAPTAQGKIRLLLVDETKTFSSTMRVGALAGILKKSGTFDVAVKMVDVTSSYADPLAGESPAESPYDIILIIPRGIDDGSVDQIWLVTRGFSELPPPAVQGIKMLAALVDKVFAGLARATDVSQDLFPGFFSALYVKEGWL